MTDAVPSMEPPSATMISSRIRCIRPFPVQCDERWMYLGCKQMKEIGKPNMVQVRRSALNLITFRRVSAT